MADSIRFTDSKGNPVSWEAFESLGYTEGLQLPGQLMITIRCKKGILMLAARAEDEEDFLKLGPVMYQAYTQENLK